MAALPLPRDHPMPMFDLEQLRHAVQLAIAPVFLLNAVAALLGAIAGRLARIIDRARVLEERLEDQLSRRPELDHDELRRLKTRGRLVNMSIGSEEHTSELQSPKEL